MKADVLTVGSHVTDLADSHVIENFLEELAELLLGSEILVQTVQSLVELALEQGPDALNAVEGRRYNSKDNYKRDKELTIGRLKLSNEAVLD